MPPSTPVAIDVCHQLLLWLIPLLDHFPRSRRFTLGNRLEERLLTVLELLVQAAYSREKRESLAKANRLLETCRHLWRLAWELKIIDKRRFEYGARMMDDLGRQIGGWIKKENKRHEAHQGAVAGDHPLR